MWFYNNRCKVLPFIPLNPVSQNALFSFYIPPLGSTFVNTRNQSVGFKLNKSICWGRGETPSSLPMRRNFSQILDFKFFRRVLNFVCFLMGNSPASEYYMSTFRNTLFHRHRRVGMKNPSYLSAYEDGTDSVFRKTSAYKIQTPGNYPEQSIQHSLKFFNIHILSSSPSSSLKIRPGHDQHPL